MSRIGQRSAGSSSSPTGRSGRERPRCSTPSAGAPPTPNRFLKFIGRRGIGLNKGEVIVNRSLKGKPPASLDDIERTLGKRIFWFFPNDFDFTISSINCGIPLVKSHPKTALAKNIQEFIAKLQNPLAHQHYRGVKGFLGRDV